MTVCSKNCTHIYTKNINCFNLESYCIDNLENIIVVNVVICGGVGTEGDRKYIHILRYLFLLGHPDIALWANYLKG